MTREPLEFSAHPNAYRSYLLRVWRDGAEGPWRASLEHVVTHERHLFASLERLCLYLFALETLSDRVEESAAPPTPCADDNE